MNPDSSSPSMATKTLAAVGFVTLVAAGLALAILAARAVPAVVGSIGSAAVSLSSLFSPAAPSEPINVGTTTPATTTPPIGGTPATTTPPAAPRPITAGPKQTDTVPLGGATTTATLSGLPDLRVRIDAVGYLATTSTDSVVPATTVPHGMRPAVRFTIENIGTNRAGAWRFSASIPTVSGFVYQSPIQQPLNPGDRIVYTLGFDQARAGADQAITIVANYDNGISESTAANNQGIAKVTVLGS